MESAAESFCGLFLLEFKHVAEAADGEMVTRFFKLLPLVGRTDVVPEAYGCYVCQGVAARARDTLAEKRQAATNEASELSDFSMLMWLWGGFRILRI